MKKRFFSVFFSRIFQYAKLYLYSPSAGLYTCPLAMTDGAAKVIQELKLYEATGNAFGRLTTRNPEKFWTSGQWMTEKKGGSDVGKKVLKIISKLFKIHLKNF